jgi:hypothetical protein
MTADVETRYLIVTLPYVSGEESDSVAELIDTDVLTDGFTSLGTVEHALGLVVREGLHCFADDDAHVTVTDVTLDQTASYTPNEARALAGALLRAAGDAETVTSTCRHCDRTITLHNGSWLCLEAGWDDENGDGMWRETCEDHDTFTAEHEPVSA